MSRLFATDGAQRPWWAVAAAWWLAMLTVLNIFLGARAITEGNRINARVDQGVTTNNFKFCSLLYVAVRAGHDTPPVTNNGKTQLANSIRLYDDFRCAQVTGPAD